MLITVTLEHGCSDSNITTEELTPKPSAFNDFMALGRIKEQVLRERCQSSTSRVPRYNDDITE